MSTDVEKLVEQVTALPDDEQRRFRELLDASTSQQPSSSLEDDFKQRLLRSGLVREIKHPRQTVSAPRCPRVDIQGKPLSETIIEERR